MALHSLVKNIPAFYTERDKFPKLVAVWKSLVVRGTGYPSIYAFQDQNCLYFCHLSLFLFFSSSLLFLN